MEGDVQIRHCDQTWHDDVGGEACDQKGFQVVFGALAGAASPEEGLVGVWKHHNKQKIINEQLLKDNLHTCSQNNSSYYTGN